tara:strand:+ start:1318 stop:2304 length:987 start_codon:yes stop_codon:yes gene_type:complete
MIFYIILFTISFGVSYLVVINSNLISKKLNIFDLPNKNSIHKFPTPKTGGIIIMLIILINFLTSSLNGFEFLNLVEFLIIFIIFIIGLIDDITDLKPVIRIILLSVLSVVLITFNEIFLISDLNFKNFYKSNIFLGDFNIFFTVFCIIVFCNSFNFVDGINGLAISLGILWVFILPIDLGEKILVCTSLFFILINNIKNKIFLGNSGSLVLSFYIAIKFIENYNKHEFLLADQILICFLIPGLDLIRLFFERILNKKSPFSGDLNHLHHLMIKFFSSANKSLVFYFLIVLIPIMFSVFTEIKSLYIILITVIFYLSFVIYIKKNLKNL